MYKLNVRIAYFLIHCRKFSYSLCLPGAGHLEFSISKLIQPCTQGYY